MRTILILAAAAGAASLAAAAIAAPGRSGGHPKGGHGFSGKGAWAANPGRRAGHGRPHRGWGPIRPGDDRRRHGRSGHGDGGPVYFDGGGYGYGIAGPSGLISPWGNGFFAGGGGEVGTKDGRPVYGYDRSYPYEWAPPARAPERARPPEPEPEPRCEVERGVTICRGW